MTADCSLAGDRKLEHRRTSFVQRRAYQRRPTHHDYRLTEKGIYLRPILISLKDRSARWGKWLDGEPLNIRHKACGHLTSLKIVCSHCDEPINARDVTQEMSPAMLGNAP